MEAILILLERVTVRYSFFFSFNMPYDKFYMFLIVLSHFLNQLCRS